ncbi:MAG: hypothetical protein IT443_11845 [Phycisphaeraceae bacterium]|nr:hypothetical protein [Phycisphaeraceae bacterium]
MALKMTPRRMSRAVAVDFQKREHSRKNRLNLLARYVGRSYGPGQALDTSSHPLAMIYQAVTTLVPNLVFRDPVVAVSTEFGPYRQYARIFELALNHLVRHEIKLRRTLRKVITDAIFSDGWIKVGIADSGRSLDLGGEEGSLKIGQPYADRVDGDDIFYDSMARDLEEAKRIGNRFRLSKQAAMDCGLYDPDEIRKLKSRYDYPVKAEVSLLSSGTQVSGQARDVIEYVDMVECYCPEDNRLVTMPYDPEGTCDKYLRVGNYEGTDEGPYIQLGLAYVPDNILPAAPASVWYDLETTANKVARKLARQAERQKSILAYEPSAAEDAEEIREASDGDTVQVDNIEAIKEVSFGGVTAEGYQFMVWAKQWFSEMAMNIDLLSGAGSNEPTATQAEMVQSNSNVRLSDLQNIVYQFTTDVCRALGKILHTDPLIELPLIQRRGGTEQQVYYTPEMRMGESFDYTFEVKPYSMARQDPNVKVRRLLEFTSSGIPALVNAQMMLGPSFRIDNALDILGRNMGIDELDELIDIQALSKTLALMMDLLNRGVPIDQKMARFLMNPTVGGPGGDGGEGLAGPGAVRPQQPNPMAWMAPGISPENERNSMAQETGGELQSTYTRPGLPSRALL